MRLFRCFILLLMSAGFAGCAARAPVLKPAAVTVDPHEATPFEQIRPPLPLPPPMAAAPTTRPSVSQLLLYARACDAAVKNQWPLCVDLLQKVAAADPDSFSPWYELGQAYVSLGNADDSAIAAFENAARINPDHLVLQSELGQLYINRLDYPTSLLHLRLAVQTSDYAQHDSDAIVADFRLASALRGCDYDRAALERFFRVMHEMEEPPLMYRDNQSIIDLYQHADSIYMQIGELLEKHGYYDQAAKAFEPAADAEPGNIDLQRHEVLNLARSGKVSQARQRMVDLIKLTHASPASLKVLDDFCQAWPASGGALQQLRQLHRDNPTDFSILFALVDALADGGFTLESDEALRQAWQLSPENIRLARRWFMQCRRSGQTEQAARVLVTSLTASPQSLEAIRPLWGELFQPTGPGPLTLPSAAAMVVPANETPALQVLIASQAHDSGRPALERQALTRATTARPVFAPAFDEQLKQLLLQPDLDSSQKKQAIDQLLQKLQLADPALADQLRGEQATASGDTVAATAAFERAATARPLDAVLQLRLIESRHKIGKDPAYEEALWRLLNDHPLFQDGYLALYRYDADGQTRSVDQAGRLLALWLGHDPQCPMARILSARLADELGETSDAQQQLLALHRDDPDNPDAFFALHEHFARINRLDRLIVLLEQTRQHRPADVDLVSRLVSLYLEAKRPADAIRLLDQTRQQVAGDAALLYPLVAEYALLGQKQAQTDVLKQVLAVDPDHAGANNDLGFELAEQGKDLAAAETMIRLAVAAEPDNADFLDSLGWVLYKQRRFDQSKTVLEQAISPLAQADPVMLDHLGDTLYRMGHAADARQRWQRSLDGIGPQTDREELKQLRLRLIEKIHQLESKKQVDVAPVPTT